VRHRLARLHRMAGMSSAPKHAPRDTLDRYYTPTVLAEAIVAELPVGIGKDSRGIWEPHVGGGAFARAIMARRPECRLRVSDVDPTSVAMRDMGGDLGDFLDLTGSPWAVIGNPPYGDAEEHVLHALAQAERHVVFLLRLAFCESAGRVGFWAGPGSCLRKCWVMAERPSFTGTGTDSCAYGVFWWDKSYKGKAEIVPGWSWVHHRQPSLFGGGS
jgi:hypothetical protein